MARLARATRTRGSMQRPSKRTAMPRASEEATMTRIRRCATSRGLGGAHAALGSGGTTSRRPQAAQTGSGPEGCKRPRRGKRPAPRARRPRVAMPLRGRLGAEQGGVRHVPHLVLLGCYPTWPEPVSSSKQPNDKPLEPPALYPASVRRRWRPFNTAANAPTT